MEKVNGWRYYNHAALPVTAPHEVADLQAIQTGEIWGIKGKPLFARWTENFDLSEKTEWWYCIKDEPFDFAQVKSKRRTEIRKGLKNCAVLIEDPTTIVDKVHEILELCYREYPVQYRPECNIEKTQKICDDWKKSHVFFSAYNSEGEFLGFAAVEGKDEYVNFEILKVPSKYQNLEVTAALIYHMLNFFMKEDSPYKYVCDGERNLVHQTNFMEYLVDKFAFRYAYCDLKIAYRPLMKLIVTMLYPFRTILAKLKGVPMIYNVVAVLQMEEIARKTRRNA